MTQRLRDTLVFSVIAILLLTVVLRFLGLRSSFASIILSILITVGLNLALSAWADHRARTRRDHG
ncbi:hypothetical protein JSY14_04625 [Brachybacterium sp. EF45031]|uniref:hypothetical protein n=1 Tax=Brachybacterium sillae TaxID=2810536 RepID=UPI00217E8DFD|nr:hypothetical protein [Brachybacterium sillae]MCS6711335.1 hypothetical protein [Brachybacterium sillae]